ncbi:MAG: hypothetical protein RI894_287 [Bacteroidota bacterium]|jgi:FKBP-type peptidyl-prolyl cis-trans isomerase
MKFVTVQKISLFLMAIFFFAHCEPDQATIFTQDKQKIADYIAKNNLSGVVTTETGLSYRITDNGTTATKPVSTSTVACYYKGYLLDGSVFDSYDRSKGAATVFSLSRVIPGWTEGIPKINKGGKAQLFIPSKLGYGTSGTSGIPANSVLIFDVELIDFQ